MMECQARGIFAVLLPHNGQPGSCQLVYDQCTKFPSGSRDVMHDIRSGALLDLSVEKLEINWIRRG